MTVLYRISHTVRVKIYTVQYLQYTVLHRSIRCIGVPCIGVQCIGTEIGASAPFQHHLAESLWERNKWHYNFKLNQEAACSQTVRAF